MGLGPFSGTAGSVATAVGTAALFLAAAVGAAYIALQVGAHVILWLFGLLA